MILSSIFWDERIFYIAHLCEPFPNSLYIFFVASRNRNLSLFVMGRGLLFQTTYISILSPLEKERRHSISLRSFSLFRIFSRRSLFFFALIVPEKSVYDSCSDYDQRETVKIFFEEYDVVPDDDFKCR